VTAFLDELIETDDVGHAELMAYTFNHNDPGVAGLSMALNAARIVTFYSCSAGRNHHADYPMVGSVPDRARAELLLGLLRKSGCGVGQTYGRWYIYGPSIRHTHALANAIISSREAFDALPPPPWTTDLKEVLEERDEF